MRTTLRITLLLLSLSGFIFSLVQLSKYWEYEDKAQNIATLMNNSVSNEQLDSAITSAIHEDRLDDARMYLNIAHLYHYPLDFPALEAEIEQRNTIAHRINTNVKHFAKGFLNGKGSDGAGIAGSVTADFTVVGDIRDLREQYNRQQEGKEVDQVIASLAGAGLGLTLLTIGTAGTTAAAKGGVSLIKLAAKTKQLTKSFSKEIMQSARRVFDWNKFSGAIKTGSKLGDLRRAAKSAFHPKAIKPLEATAKRMVRIRKASNTSDALHMLRYVDNTNDLRRVEKFTLKHGILAKGYLKLLGKGVLRTARVVRKTTKFLLSLVASLISGLFSFLFMFSYRRS